MQSYFIHDLLKLIEPEYPTPDHFLHANEKHTTILDHLIFILQNNLNTRIRVYSFYAAFNKVFCLALLNVWYYRYLYFLFIFFALTKM